MSTIHGRMTSPKSANEAQEIGDCNTDRISLSKPSEPSIENLSYDAQTSQQGQPRPSSVRHEVLTRGTAKSNIVPSENLPNKTFAPSSTPSQPRRVGKQRSIGFNLPTANPSGSKIGQPSDPQYPPRAFPAPSRVGTFASDISAGTIDSSTTRNTRRSSSTTITAFDSSSRTPTFRADAVAEQLAAQQSAVQHAQPRRMLLKKMARRLRDDPSTPPLADKGSERKPIPADTEPSKSTETPLRAGSQRAQPLTPSDHPSPLNNSCPDLPSGRNCFRNTPEVDDKRQPDALDCSNCRVQAQDPAHSPEVSRAPTSIKVPDVAEKRPEVDVIPDVQQRQQIRRIPSSIKRLIPKFSTHSLFSKIKHIVSAPYSKGTSKGNCSRKSSQRNTQRADQISRKQPAPGGNQNPHDRDGNGDGQPGQPPDHPEIPQDMIEDPRYKCLFLAMYPMRFQECAEFTCLWDIGRLKQHLTRCHQDDLSEDQKTALSARHPNTRATWDILFTIVFPGNPIPTSPYLVGDLPVLPQWDHSIIRNEFLRTIPNSIQLPAPLGDAQSLRGWIDGWLRVELPGIIQRLSSVSGQAALPQRPAAPLNQDQPCQSIQNPHDPSIYSNFPMPETYPPVMTIQTEHDPSWQDRGLESSSIGLAPYTDRRAPYPANTFLHPAQFAPGQLGNDQGRPFAASIHSGSSMSSLSTQLNQAYAPSSSTHTYSTAQTVNEPVLSSKDQITQSFPPSTPANYLVNSQPIIEPQSFAWGGVGVPADLDSRGSVGQPLSFTHMTGGNDLNGSYAMTDHFVAVPNEASGFAQGYASRPCTTHCPTGPHYH